MHLSPFLLPIKTLTSFWTMEKKSIICMLLLLNPCAHCASELEKLHNGEKHFNQNKQKIEIGDIVANKIWPQLNDDLR